MSWTQYAIKRTLSSVFVLFGASVVIFSIVRLIPGDPAQVLLGDTAREQQLEVVRRELGLHRPVWEQYFIWLSDVLTLDLGRSYMNNQLITELLAIRYPRSLQLAVLTMILATAIGVPLAIWGASNRNTSKDYVALFFSQFGVSIPSFFLGVVLILLFANLIPIFPPSGYHSFFDHPLANFVHLVLPVVTLTVINAAIITRYLRSEMLENLNSEYVQTARAYGHSERRIVLKYVAKNALIPTITVIGIQFGGIIGGVVIIEEVFSYPGIGLLLLDSILRRDYPVIQMSLLAIAATFIVVNLIVDLVYGYLDPRIRH
ncbi:ABC transporter permease [Natrarchaeobius oligotrophus]|nr:ABC transporter permease [Natrarchaeobius chitinivorans]